MNKFLASLSLVLLPAFALAQTAAWNDIKGELKEALEAKGDPARGKAAFVPCEGCHRADAAGRPSGAYPRLSGQHMRVLVKQITDIRAGRRSVSKMEPFIDDHVLTPFDIADIAVYVHSLPVPNTNAKGPGTTLVRGKQLYDKDCATCHGAKGEGDAAKFYPMVAAQHYRYLLREVTFIRDGDRRNSNPDMVKAIVGYNAADLEAVSDFMAQLAPLPR
ncbi:MAG: c-type cytochrome [Burkholderiales bacterium]|nr:c-type cytochrome [Burkholderiales bacterium]